MVQVVTGQGSRDRDRIVSLNGIATENQNVREGPLKKEREQIVACQGNAPRYEEIWG